jgi:hypothetical protein
MDSSVRAPTSSLGPPANDPVPSFQDIDSASDSSEDDQDWDAILQAGQFHACPSIFFSI